MEGKFEYSKPLLTELTKSKPGYKEHLLVIFILN